MDPVTISLGAAAVLFGIYTIVIRITSPEKLGKLSAMKQKFGNLAGVTIHTIAYSLVPIGFGVVLINAGMNGVSIAQFMAR